MKEGLFIIARGIGQVMFQNNALSGLLMLAGIACNSWILALLALAGNIVSTLTACLCKYSREDIRNGLYGFNGTLVGIAIGVFMEINISSMFYSALPFPPGSPGYSIARKQFRVSRHHLSLRYGFYYWGTFTFSPLSYCPQYPMFPRQ